MAILVENLAIMVGKTDKNPQLNVFKPLISSFINLTHELCVLAKQIEWEKLEQEFIPYYKNFGRPSVPLRKMIGLVLLKHIYNLSDENVVERWKENPYWQHFCGEIYFQTNNPIDPSEFVHFRNRIGEEGVEKLLKLSISLFGKESEDNEVCIDSTVQEKNITFPTDTKLQNKIIKKCIKIADKEEIKLRQTYKRVIKKLMLEQRFRSHPKRKKKALSAARKIKTIAGRLVRDIERKMTEEQAKKYQKELLIFKRVLKQERNSKDKIYSLHEPDVKCIAKGKESKQYEFGNKSSIVMTRTSGIIVGALAFKENIYDGDTLPSQIEQVKRLTNHAPKVAIVDRGYRGRKKVFETEIVSPKVPTKNATQYQKRKARKRFRARAGIEPIIGHIKHDHRMLRNYLKGTIGDSINTILAATGFNFMKRLRQIKAEIKNLLYYFFQKEILYKIYLLLFLKKWTF